MSTVRFGPLNLPVGGGGYLRFLAMFYTRWMTRPVVQREDTRKLNPLMPPFAGLTALYPAVQLALAFLDYAGQRMGHSQEWWLRRL